MSPLFLYMTHAQKKRKHYQHNLQREKRTVQRPKKLQTLLGKG